MKWFFVLFAIIGAVTADGYCHDETIKWCAEVTSADLNCNATFSGFMHNITYLQKYANNQIRQSYDYLLIAANFGTYAKNRPGFEKTFHGLSDKAWTYGIDIIKYITKRGGSHYFNDKTVSVKADKILGLDEIDSMAYALDVEKVLATEAHGLHARYSHANHRRYYDPEVAHFLDEKFIEPQVDVIRKLSGYTNDIKKLIKAGSDSSLSFYLYDEYLQKQ